LSVNAFPVPPLPGRFFVVIGYNCGMYYTPPNILEPKANSGAFLLDAVEIVISNPPYQTRHKRSRWIGWLLRLFRL
jgi:hypothetical protein